VSVSGHKPIIGIMGGIGSGKSTVAREFGKLGCAVIDADKIAHDLLDEGAVRERIVGLFGGGILDSAGKIDRRELARVVFGDVDKLSLGLSNNITAKMRSGRSFWICLFWSRLGGTNGATGWYLSSANDRCGQKERKRRVFSTKTE